MTEKLKNYLTNIKDRYFRPVIARREGLLTHHGDCDVHRSLEVYGTAPCTCGLNHDLKCLDVGLIEKLNPKFWMEESQKHPKTYSEYCGNREFLELHFGKIEPLTDEEQEELDQKEWQLLAEVFGSEYIEYLRARAKGEEK